MNNCKNKHKIWIKTVAMAVVCLFTINTIAGAYLSGETYISKTTLAAESRFVDLRKFSMQEMFEIIGGIRLFLADKNTNVVNGILTESYRGSGDKRRIEFQKGDVKKEDGMVAARFKVVGKGELTGDVFEIEYSDTNTAFKKCHAGKSGDDINVSNSGLNKVLPVERLTFGNVFQENDIMSVRKVEDFEKSVEKEYNGKDADLCSRLSDSNIKNGKMVYVGAEYAIDGASRLLHFLARNDVEVSEVHFIDTCYNPNTYDKSHNARKVENMEDIVEALSGPGFHADTEVSLVGGTYEGLSRGESVRFSVRSRGTAGELKYTLFLHPKDGINPDEETLNIMKNTHITMVDRVGLSGCLTNDPGFIFNGVKNTARGGFIFYAEWETYTPFTVVPAETIGLGKMIYPKFLSDKYCKQDTTSIQHGKPENPYFSTVYQKTNSVDDDEVRRAIELDGIVRKGFAGEEKEKILKKIMKIIRSLDDKKQSAIYERFFCFTRSRKLPKKYKYLQTIISAIGHEMAQDLIKERNSKLLIYKEKVFPEQHKDEKYLLMKTSRFLKSYPVNMHIDLSVIPQDGLWERDREEQLERNMKTLARQIAWHNQFGLDIRYILKNDTDGGARRMLEEELTDLGDVPGINLNELLPRIRTKHTGPKVIDVRLENFKLIDKNRFIEDREYIVALEDGEGGITIPNYSAASVIGLSLASLRVAKDKGLETEEYRKMRKKVLESFRSIYKRYRLIEKETDFIVDELELMVSGSSDTKHIFVREYMLPPAAEMDIEKINELHWKMQEILWYA